MAEREIRLLVVDDAEDSRVVREMLAAERSRFSVHSVETLVGALDALAQFHFDIVLLELSLPDSQGLDTFETVRRHGYNLPVVIYTGTSNELLALTAVERGAQDYLMKGRLSSQALARVLQYSLARHHGAAQAGRVEHEKARVIGMLGAKGGVGVTTLACHYAIELKQQSGGKVLLLDLDLASASSAFLLKTESRYSAVDAATNLHRLDETFWGGLVSAGPGGVDVMGSPGASACVEPVSGDRLRHVLRFIRTLYDFIVVDMGRFTPLSLALFEETTEVFLVTTSGLPEMYEAGRILRKLVDLGLTGNRLRVVFNRVSRGVQDPAAGFEKALRYPVFWALGDYSREIEDAFAERAPLNENLAIRKEIGRMTAKALGREETPEPRGLLGLLRFARARG